MPSKKVNEKIKGKKVQESQQSEVLDDEDESEYDEENGSEDDDFIVDDEQAQEEYIQAQERQRKEIRKLQKKQSREKKRVGSNSAGKGVAKKRVDEDDEMDDDDYQLILDNQRRKKKLTKIVADESEEEQNLHQKVAEKRRNRQDLGEDDQRENSSKIQSHQKDDLFKKVKHEKAKESRKPQDFLEEDEERVSSFKQQEKKDKFINEDLDDLFATQQDYEIMINDIPERLALKLKGRLDPTQEELDQEAVWLFNNIIDQHMDISLGGQRIKDMQFKITEALKLFKNKKNDIPFITKYRQKNLLPELKPQDVWRVFNLDIEYSKFNQQKTQVISFFQNIFEFESSRKEEIKNFINQLQYINNNRDLKDFQALQDFYKQYFQKELELQAQSSQNKKLPVQKPMFIFSARQKKLDEFSRRCTLAPQDFAENIQEDKLLHLPNQPQNLLIKELASEYSTPDQKDLLEVIQEMCDYTVLELQCQPDIRRFFKKFVKENGFLETEPTEKGRKELDVFHPSYRVKKVRKWLKELEDDDFFLDVEQNLALGLITFKIDVQEKEKHLAKLFEKYQNPVESQCQQNEKNYIKIRKEIQQNFCKDEPQNLSGKVYKSFSQSIIEEVEVELREDAENFILNQCRKKYQQLLESSYYKILNEDKQFGSYGSIDKRLGEEEIIPQRERLVVMGAVFHAIDNKNYSTTICVLDKYGELVAHKNFLFLIPPRKQKGKDGEIIQRPGEEEEIAKYQDQKRQLQDLLRKHSVDLIVVCADCLEARRLKKSLVEIAMSNQNPNDEENEYQDDDRYNVVQDHNQNLYQKEPMVIWGRPEVPRLFADSNYSQKLHKNHPKELKKAISVARFEQDPMLEVLNLWSPIMNENQALNLNLHPLQKHVNKGRLMDILEEVNVQTVNNVGVDLNIMLHHKHMHNQLQFVSGLGPRKAAYLISKLKHIKEPIYNRMEIWEKNLLQKRCHTSSIGFIKIRVPPENKKNIQPKAIDYLDQTRIHPSSYEEMEGIACFCIHPEIDPQQLDEIKKKEAVNELFRHPEKLKQMVDSGQINNKLGDGDFSYQQTYDQIIFDFLTPFRDPREDKALSSIENPRFDIKELFYCLINESERTFKIGITVQSTVVRIYQPSGSHNGRLLCRLENGLEANVNKDDADFFSQVQEKSVITGRIDEIKFGSSKDDESFSVTLKCRQQHLRRHDMYINNMQDVPEEDLVNYNFQQAEEQSNLQKRNSITFRKINHPKFANINSMTAIMNLNKEDNGEFYFRPSSKGTDHLTLTWKFFENNIVHIDIIEENKPIGANIGSLLRISDETYENLQEIVERYVTICNRSLIEVIQHPKFMKTTRFDEIKDALEKEKGEDENRIPYRFTVLSDFPQFIVLGYMPKQSVVREFIKVKPRGFHFHNQYFFPFQSLINWFKCNFRTRDYQNILKKSSSPQKVGQKPMQIQAPIGMNIDEDRQMVSDFKAPYDSKPRTFGRGQRESQPENQYGEYQNQRDNDTRTSSFQRNRDDRPQFRDRAPGGGGNKSCFKCNEEGHFAKDCHNAGSGAGRGGGGGGRNCHNCGESGHFVKECPQPRGSKGRGGRPDYQNRGGSPYKRQRNDNDGYSNREEAASGWCRNEIQGQADGAWGGNQNNY